MAEVLKVHLLLQEYVELRPARSRTGRTLEAAGECCAELHSTSRPTNNFLEASPRDANGRDGRWCPDRSPEYTAMQLTQPPMHPLVSCGRVVEST